MEPQAGGVQLMLAMPLGTATSAGLSIAGVLNASLYIASRKTSYIG